MSSRRDARMRREYIFRKSLHPKYRAEYNAKKRIERALASSDKIPETLRGRFDRLDAEMKMDDVVTKDSGDPKLAHLDDEYTMAGIREPKVILTTCRTPTNKLQRFVKEMKLCFPNATRVNRGNIGMKELISICKSSEFSDLIIFHEHSGICDGMIVCHLPYGPSAYFSLSDVIARHDLPKSSLAAISEQLPHLAFNNFSTKLGERVSRILKYLYPAFPSDSQSSKSRRIISFNNVNDFILFRHHVYRKKPDREIELVEVGPRFTMRLYQIKLGTMDQKEAPDEWVLRPYMNSSWRRKAL